jgi:hypothetical protein
MCDVYVLQCGHMYGACHKLGGWGRGRGGGGRGEEADGSHQQVASTLLCRAISSILAASMWSCHVMLAGGCRSINLPPASHPI